MKIAMIGHKRIPSREGGVEVVVEELSTRLVKDGHQVDVYNRKGKNVQDKNADKDKQKVKEYKGVKIITIPTINKKGLDALIYSFFASVRALFGKYDVLHYHAEGSCAMLWIPHLFRKRIVVTIHGLDWQRSKWGGFATKYIKFGEKLAAKYADEIIVLSKGVQKYFKETYNRETNFIPNGVNKPEIKEAKIIKEKWDLSKDSYILFLARIVPEKGLHYLIDAYKQIRTDKKLVIAGGASHTNSYLEQIKEKVKDNKNIIMTGFVQGEELEELYSNCYLYCLPSDVEGMPISLLEAMSYGDTCLVSDIEENIQVIGEYAYKFKKSNVEDLKKQLEGILNKNKNIYKEEISDYILKEYNWNEVFNKTKDMYFKKNKEVLIVVNMAGFANFLISDIEMLQKKGYNVTFAANTNKIKWDDTREKLENRNVRIENVDFDMNNPLRFVNLKAYFQVKKILKKHRFDLVHCHTPIASAITRICANKYRKKGTKIIYTSHGFNFNKYNMGLKNKCYFYVERILSTFCDAIVTINKEDFENAQNMNCNKVYYINGYGVKLKCKNKKIDIDKCREKLKIDKNKINILSVGRLVKLKNYEVIIKAISELENKGDYSYLICGSDETDELSDELKKIAKENGVNLCLMGFKKNINEVMQCIDIGAVPSIKEGLRIGWDRTFI